MDEAELASWRQENNDHQDLPEMVNLIVSHGSQSRNITEQNRRISTRSKARPSSEALMNTLKFTPPPADTAALTNNSSSEYQLDFPMSSFSTNNSSMGNVDRYRTNGTNLENEHEFTHDYDSSVTELYELLESSQWEAAISRCLNFPEEVRTWIVRRGDSQLRWKVLPLHAAIIFKAPQKVVFSILTIFPLASSKQDDQGMLPLHLAFRHKMDEAVLQKLLETYPVGTNQKDRRGRIPIDHATVASFSGKFVHLYAHTVSSHDGRLGNLEQRDESNDAKNASIELLYEQRMKDMESYYEDRISRLHLTAEECKKDARILYGRRSMHIEAEVELLRSSLERAKAKSQQMLEVIKLSQDNEKHLETKFQVVLKSQKALHNLCMKQQRQLEQAQSMKKEMLKSMLDSEEDRSAISMASEISKISSNLVVCGDDILAHIISSKVEKEGDKRNPIAPVETEENSIFGFQYNSNRWMRSIAEHGDDISGITEVSQF